MAIHFSHGEVQGLFYHAVAGNFAFLGEAPMKEIAEHIARSVGPSGTNPDYLFGLAQALRNMDIDDPHVFELEQRVQALMTKVK